MCMRAASLTHTNNELPVANFIIIWMYTGGEVAFVHINQVTVNVIEAHQCIYSNMNSQIALGYSDQKKVVKCEILIRDEEWS